MSPQCDIAREELRLSFKKSQGRRIITRFGQIPIHLSRRFNNYFSAGVGEGREFAGFCILRGGECRCKSTKIDPQPKFPAGQKPVVVEFRTEFHHHWRRAFRR